MAVARGYRPGSPPLGRRARRPAAEAGAPHLPPNGPVAARGAICEIRTASIPPFSALHRRTADRAVKPNRRHPRVRDNSCAPHERPWGRESQRPARAV